jgi:hypothetical protein
MGQTLTASLRTWIKAPTWKDATPKDEPWFATARTLVLFILLAFCLPVHAGYDGKYKAYRGDLNNDGHTDLFLSRPPDVVVIPADDVSVPIVTTRADHLLLLQNANRTFTANTTLSATDLAALRTWSPSSVQLVVKDINVDGQKDLFIKNFSGDASFGAGIDDQIVFAANNSLPVHVRAADAGFRQFFTQIHGWAADSNYFVNTAIDNGWYHYQGQQKTGWWYVHYVDAYYQYDGGKSYLDDADDPTNPNNPPSFCSDYPQLCWFNPNVGYWWIYGTYIENIQVIIEYEHFNQDALLYAQAVGNAFNDPNVALQSNPAQAESILESYLEAPVGETVAGVLADPLPWPELPPESEPVPQPRKIPKPLPDAANDPDFFPKSKWGWKILSRVGIIVCGVFLCSAEGESDEWLSWREIGWEWAIQDLIEREIKGQPKVVIGEGEGQIAGQYVFNRVPNAAQAKGAIYFNPGVFTVNEWTHDTDVALWYMNWGWLTSMMLKQALFYDIGLYGPRVTRGKFYPCERRTLEGYASREEFPFEGTSGYAYGRCELDDPQALP